MKPSFRIFAASALVAPAALFAAHFEGEIALTMTAGTGKPQAMIYKIKGDKVRMEIQTPKGTSNMIMDTTKKETIMIMDKEKMYMVMAIPDAAEKKVEKNMEDSTLEKTGETEKILGYTATKYISTSDKGKSEMWLAEGIGTFMGMGNSNPMAGGGRRGGPAPKAAWEQALAGKELFPLRVVSFDKAGNQSFRMETTAIKKGKLDDALFTPPEDYQKFDMSGMGGMLKGMVPGFGK